MKHSKRLMKCVMVGALCVAMTLSLIHISYRVSNEEEFTIKHNHCIYDKENELHYTKINETLENDMDYFYELFNVVK